MKYKLTNHAQKQIIKRDILVKWIEAALTFPAKIETDTHFFFSISQKKGNSSDIL